MALDLWIYGSGFGESLLLIWDAPDATRRAAFIDCYGGSQMGSHAALSQWHRQGEPAVAFVAVTHPHLDHIQNAGTVLRAIGKKANTAPEKIVWWGGHELHRTRSAYDHAARMATGEPGQTAQSTMDFLSMTIAAKSGFYPDHAARRTDETVGFELNTPYFGPTTHGDIKFHALSPWLDPQTDYTAWINAKVRAKPAKGVANSTSLGFLVEYGDAQLILGGDVEAPNWTAFRSSHATSIGTPPLHPCLIKVSHHGSTTGHIPGMWNRGDGFFGWRGSTEDDALHCVITPWRNAGRSLPSPSVVRMIARAGCHVWETGHAPTLGAIDGAEKPARPINSFVHFKIDAQSNRADLIEQRFCNYTAPVP